VGKSTLVRDCLNGEQGVHIVSLTDTDELTEDSLAQKIISQQELMFSKLAKCENATVLRKALHLCKVKPVIIVECDERCTPHQIEKLLIFFEVWGDDEKLIHPVVILPSSKSAFGVQISFEELRSPFYHVPDFTEEETTRYLQELCKLFLDISDEKEAAHFITSAKTLVGNRLLDLCAVSSAILRRQERGPVSFNEANQIVHSHVENQRLVYYRSLRTFFEEISKLNVHANKELRVHFCEVFEQLDQKEYVAPKYFRRSYCSWPQLIEINARIHPHPFYLDPEGRYITFNSYHERGNDFKRLVQ